MEDKQKKNPEMPRISPASLQEEFFRILIKHGFTNEKATVCAEVFTENSIDGVNKAIGKVQDSPCYSTFYQPFYRVEIQPER